MVTAIDSPTLEIAYTHPNTDSFKTATGHLDVVSCTVERAEVVKIMIRPLVASKLSSSFRDVPSAK